MFYKWEIGHTYVYNNIQTSGDLPKFQSKPKRKHSFFKICMRVLGFVIVFWRGYVLHSFVHIISISSQSLQVIDLNFQYIICAFKTKTTICQTATYLGSGSVPCAHPLLSKIERVRERGDTHFLPLSLILSLSPADRCCQ